ncbi:MAG: hypothetical protein WD696_11620 [Bryobacteraceae bacterium]
MDGIHGGTLSGRAAILWLLCLPGTLAAQSLHVYSEFRRIDPFGNVVSADRGGTPREILSPAVARGGFASFHLAVTMPRDVPFTLHIAQNPDDTLGATLYRESFVQHGEDWIPDALTPISLPYNGVITNSNAIEEQNTLPFWLDLWIPPKVPPGRVRVEAQLFFKGRWIIYPLEVRIQSVGVPKHGWIPGRLAPVESAVEAVAMSPVAAFLCGLHEPADDPPPTVRRMIRRNVLQDLALARTIEDSKGPDTVAGLFLAELGTDDLEGWCESRPPEGPHREWYLKVRDSLRTGEVR